MSALGLNVTDLGHLRWTLTNVPQRTSERGRRSASPLARDRVREATIDTTSSVPNVTVTVPAALPGSVHGALRDAGVLPQDPLVGFNEQTYRWVALSDWTYTTTLDVAGDRPAATDGVEEMDLVLEAVDTFATVELNGRVLATLDNSFSRHVVPLNAAPSSLRAGPNTLRLVFRSALTAAAAAAAAYPYPVPDNSALVKCKTWPCPPETGEVIGALPHYNFARKGASDSGWDWGPAFSPVGVYTAPRLVARGAGELYLTDVVTVTTVDGAADENGHDALGSGAALVVRTVHRAPRVASAAPSFACITYAVDGVRLPASASRAVVRAPGRGEDNVEEVIHDQRLDMPERVRLWWPRGYGPQNLYDVTVTSTPCGGKEDAGSYAATTTTMTRRIGFRRVELVTDNDGAGTGDAFHLRINGSPVFVKGANVVNVDAFHGHGGGVGGSDETPSTVDTTERLLSAAVAANMNAVRVWGGGRYMEDFFYSRCDELGLLVWQESMFACAMYPRDARFLTSVRAETVFQARRLASHPSVAVWGGNNENEAALEWYEETKANPTMYAVDLSVVFVDTLRQALLSAVPRVGGTFAFAFVDTSPSNGVVSHSPYVKAWGDVSDPARGDTHYYNYEDDCEDEGTYPSAKFISEFGFQSHPSLPTYIGALPPLEMRAGAESVSSGHLVNGSSFLSFRQRHPGGDAQMLRQIQRRFKVRSLSRRRARVTTTGRATEDVKDDDDATFSSLSFGDYVYLTQVQQARCYDTAIRKWRRGGGGPGAARGTMGVLYWQLNDVWAGPTWSSIEHGGWRRKLLHHAVGRAFAPLVLSVTRTPRHRVGSSTGAGRDADEGVELWSTCECGAGGANDLGTGTMRVETISWSTGRVLHATVLPVYRSKRFDSVRVWTGRLNNLLTSKCGSPGECFLSLSATLEFDAAGAKDQGARESRWTPPRSFSAELEYFPGPGGLSGAALPRAVVTVTHVALLSRTSAEVVLETSAPAAQVRVEAAREGSWSDNGLFMYPGRPVRLVFNASSPIDGEGGGTEAFLSSLTVVSLVDVVAKL